MFGYGDKTYTITLADKTEIKDLTLNGNNFVSKKKVNESLLTRENLSEVTITDGEETQTYYDMFLIQQVKYSDGWYFILGQIQPLQLWQDNIEETLCNADLMNEDRFSAIEEALCDLDLEEERNNG